MKKTEKNEKKRLEAEAEDQAFQQHSIENGWNNPEDEEASKFYIKRYLQTRRD